MADESYELTGPLLVQAAAHFSRQPQFLGYWLELYREAESLTSAGLARILGCPTDTVARLSLCFRPHPEHAWEGAEALAREFGLEPGRLFDVLHDAESHHMARETRAASLGPKHRPTRGSVPLFAAAQDREPDEPEAPEPEAPDGR